MNIFSIDQSLTRSGYVIAKQGEIMKSGLIKTENQKRKRNIGDMCDKSRRTRDILTDIVNLIDDYDVKCLVCEEYAGYSQSKAAADALATTRTIMIAISQLKGLPLFVVAAQDAKKALTQNKLASKQQMIAHADNLYPVVMQKYKNLKTQKWKLEAADVADAIGIYLAALRLPIVKSMAIL